MYGLSRGHLFKQSPTMLLIYYPAFTMSLTLPGVLYHVISLLVFCRFFELFCVISPKSQKTKPVQQILLLSSTSCRNTEFASYRTHPCKVHIYKSVVLGHSQNVWLSLLYNVRILLSSKDVPRLLMSFTVVV